MRLTRVVRLVLVALSVPLQWSGGQCPAGVDTYAHFVGDWSGRNQYERKGKWVDEAVAIQITELKQCRGLRLAYAYGDGADTPVKHRVRIITLDPANERMTSRFRIFETDDYETSGLAAFAATGLGAFAMRSGVLERGVPVAYVGEFHLSPTELSYSWDRSEQGEAPTPFGRFQLRRRTPATSAQPSQ